MGPRERTSLPLPRLQLRWAPSRHARIVSPVAGALLHTRHTPAPQQTPLLLSAPTQPRGAPPLCRAALEPPVRQPCPLQQERPRQVRGLHVGPWSSSWLWAPSCTTQETRGLRLPSATRGPWAECWRDRPLPLLLLLSLKTATRNSDANCELRRPPWERPGTFQDVCPLPPEGGPLTRQQSGPLVEGREPAGGPASARDGRLPASPRLGSTGRPLLWAPELTLRQYTRSSSSRTWQRTTAPRPSSLLISGARATGQGDTRTAAPSRPGAPSGASPCAAPPVAAAVPRSRPAAVPEEKGRQGGLGWLQLPASQPGEPGQRPSPYLSPHGQHLCGAQLLQGTLHGQTQVLGAGGREPRQDRCCSTWGSQGQEAAAGFLPHPAGGGFLSQRGTLHGLASTGWPSAVRLDRVRQKGLPRPKLSVLPPTAPLSTVCLGFHVARGCPWHWWGSGPPLRRVRKQQGRSAQGAPPGQAPPPVLPQTPTLPLPPPGRMAACWPAQTQSSPERSPLARRPEQPEQPEAQEVQRSEAVPQGVDPARQRERRTLAGGGRGRAAGVPPAGHNQSHHCLWPPEAPPRHTHTAPGKEGAHGFRGAPSEHSRGHLGSQGEAGAPALPPWKGASRKAGRLFPDFLAGEGRVPGEGAWENAVQSPSLSSRARALLPAEAALPLPAVPRANHAQQRVLSPVPLLLHAAQKHLWGTTAKRAPLAGPQSSPRRGGTPGRSTSRQAARPAAGLTPVVSCKPQLPAQAWNPDVLWGQAAFPAASRGLRRALGSQRSTGRTEPSRQRSRRPKGQWAKVCPLAPWGQEPLSHPLSKYRAKGIRPLQLPVEGLRPALLQLHARLSGLVALEKCPSHLQPQLL